MKKEFKRMIIVMLAICLAITPTGIMYAAEKDIVENESIFEIIVLDNEGNPTPDVSVALYSFLDKKVVANGITDSEGRSQMNYKPHISSFEDNEYIYGDYIIYAQKDGEEWAEYNLTKMYVNPDLKSADMEKAANETNCEGYIIQQPTVKSTREESNDKEEIKPQMQAIKKVQSYLISEKRLTPESPICVLEEKDYARFEEIGVLSKEESALLKNSSLSNETRASDDYTLRNKNVPLGYFHVSSGGKLDVTFTSSDKVKVECGVKGTAGATYNISGSRTRALQTSTIFPTYTTSKSKGGKKKYSTGGDFEEWQTVTYYGSTSYHIGIKKINGGTIMGAEGSCSDCGVSYASANSGHGTCINILNTGGVVISQFNNKSVDLGLNVSFSQIDLNLGVTRVTGGTTELKYTPKKGYNLRIYDNDKKTWHCTHKAV